MHAQFFSRVACPSPALPWFTTLSKGSTPLAMLGAKLRFSELLRSHNPRAGCGSCSSDHVQLPQQTKRLQSQWDRTGYLQRQVLLLLMTALWSPETEQLRCGGQCHKYRNTPQSLKTEENYEKKLFSFRPIIVLWNRDTDFCDSHASDDYCLSTSQGFPRAVVADYILIIFLTSIWHPGAWLLSIAIEQITLIIITNNTVWFVSSDC